MSKEFKIYFIFAQRGKKNNVSKIDSQDQDIKVTEMKNGINSNYIYSLYRVTIKYNIKEKENKNIILLLEDNQGELYIANLDLNNPEPFQYEVIFESYLNENDNNLLDQIILPFEEQFSIFKENLKNEENTLNNLYSSKLSSLIQDKSKKEFEIFLNFFIEIYQMYTNNKQLKDIIIKFFEKIDLKGITKSNNVYHNEYDILSNEEKIRKDLVNIVNDNEQLTEKIDVFLGYYYLFYQPKHFIYFNVIKGEGEKIQSHLISNRNIFQNFSTNIIDLKLIEETENLEQVTAMLSLLPSIPYIFEILSDYFTYCKISGLSDMEKKVLDLHKIMKPKKDDDLDLLLVNYQQFNENFKNVYYMPIYLKREFFVDYCKLFLNEDLRKINLIIKLLKKYNQDLKDTSKVKIEPELKTYYYETGVHLINTQKLMNRNLINFISNIEDNQLINEPDKIANGIKLDGKDIDFINELLNNNFSDFDLKEILGNQNYYILISKIFDKFNVPKDLLVIKEWKMNEDDIPEEVLEVFLKTIKRIWLNYPENHMYGLEFIIANEFAFASLKLGNYMDIITEIENQISKDKILVIYSKILSKRLNLDYDFKEHIVNFIYSYREGGPLSIWYTLITFENENDQYTYLEDNLKEIYAVRVEDFVNYPSVIEDRIILFTNLYNGQFFFSNLSEINYYKKSLEAKDNLGNLKYKDAMIMFQNIEKLDNLFIFFIPGRYREENTFTVSMLLIDFSEKCLRAKIHYDSLKTVLDFWNRFLPNEKNNKRNALKKFINEYENQPLKEFERLYQKSENYLDDLKEAEEGNKLFESIFFMEIYEQLKNNFEKTEDRNRYNHALKKFNDLKILGNNSDVNYLGINLKEILVSAVYKNYDKFNDEIEFIKKYFNFKTKNKNDYNNFNSKIFKRSLINLVKQYQEEHGEYKINADDNFDYEEEEDDQNINEENILNNLNKDDDDDDDNFNLFGPIETREEENQKPKIENEIKIPKIIEQKNELLKEMLFQFKNFFYNANKFIKRKNDMNIMDHKYIEEKKELYESYIQFFIKILKTNHNFASLRNNEFFEEIIKRVIKIYINGINLGLLENLENSNNKKEIILFSQFYDVIKFYIDKRKIQKGILFKIIDQFLESYNARDQEEQLIVSIFRNLLTRINDVDFKENKEKTNNLIIDLFIKEKHLVSNELELTDLIFNDGNSNFYYLYSDLAPYINELFKKDLESKLNFENNNVDENETNKLVIFNLGAFRTINIKIEKRKDLEELILYYFEAKIINTFNKKFCNENRNNLYNDMMVRKILRACIRNLKNESEKNKVNISILYSLAFIKCFFNKLIISLYENHELVSNMSFIFNNIIEENSAQFPSIKLYILKLLFDNVDSYYDYCQKDYKTIFQIDYNSNEDIKNLKITQLETSEKYFGFDYIFIPTYEKNYEDFNFIQNKLTEIKKNNINNDIDDKELIQKINENSNTDIFYCSILNIHFSFLYRSSYNNESVELNNINKWLSDKINNQELEIFKENELIKQIYKFLNKKNVQNEISNNNLPYKNLLSQLISARFVICTLSSNDNNLFFYQLISNVKNVISKNSNFFGFYLKNFDTFIKEKKDMNYLTYKIINYIILSHLYFGFILKLIEIDDLKKFIPLEENQENINANYLLDLLTKEFDFIQKKLLNLNGIRKTIIFMNKIFDDISPIIKSFECKDDNIKNFEENIDSSITQTITNFKDCVEEYQQLIEKIDIGKNEKKDLSSIFTRILFEENDFYNNKNINSKFPYITYLTSSNFCTYEDFRDQFLYFNNENYPLIKCVLNNDDIIEITKYISPLNDFINSVYNELALKISSDEINKKIGEKISHGTLEKLKPFNEALEKLANILKIKDIKEINRDSLISEVINIKDSNINRIYEEIISKYNEFLLNINTYKNTQEAIEPVIIQSALENQYISFALNNDLIENGNGINNMISIKDRLIELIQIYSKRNRFNIKDNLINIYDGGKIIYDYELIENKLEKEFILGKKLFSKTQKMFIFSNDVFSKERNNIFIEIMDNYPQTEIQEESFKKIDEYLESLNNKKKSLIEIYQALQYIIINKKYIDYDQEQTNLNYIIKLINKGNYFMNESFKNFISIYGDMISFNNIIFLYENVEKKVFVYLTENIKNNFKKERLTNEIKDKINAILEDQNMPINKEIFINSIKKYILRYCLGNNSNKSKILENFQNINDILNKYDIWGKEIRSNQNFGENCEKIKDINNEGNCIIKYCLNILFSNDKDNDIEEEKEDHFNIGNNPINGDDFEGFDDDLEENFNKSKKIRNKLSKKHTKYED